MRRSATDLNLAAAVKKQLGCCGGGPVVLCSGRLVVEVRTLVYTGRASWTTLPSSSMLNVASAGTPEKDLRYSKTALYAA